MKNILDSYKNFRKSGGEVIVTRKDFCKIVNEFNKHIMEFVLKGDEVKLPEKIGTISVKGKKVKTKFDEDIGRISNQAVDYGETNKLWSRCPECKERKQVVYHLNEHTNGIRYKFFWSRDRVLIENKSFYSMIFTRTNKRKLSHLIQNGKEFYVEATKY
jgi:phage FluMu protein Com